MRVVIGTVQIIHTFMRNVSYIFYSVIIMYRSSRWPCDLRRRSLVASLLGSRILIPLREWIFVSCVCCVFCGQRPLRRADHSFGGVLPGVCVCVCLCVCVCVCVGVCVCVCLSVIYKPQQEATQARFWLMRHRIITCTIQCSGVARYSGDWETNYSGYRIRRYNLKKSIIIIWMFVYSFIQLNNLNLICV